MAREVTRWEPVSSALSLRDAMDRLFEESFVWPRTGLYRDGNVRQNMLPLDVYETPDQVVVNMIAPGVQADQINIQFIEGRLIVDVSIPAPNVENVTWHYRELGCGEYHREVSLPFPVNTAKVEADLQNGYLTLRLPKAEEAKPKKIQVKTK